MSLNNKQKVTVRNLKDTLSHWDKTKHFDNSLQEHIIEEDINLIDEECGLHITDKIKLKHVMNDLLNIIRKIE